MHSTDLRHAAPMRLTKSAIFSVLSPLITLSWAASSIRLRLRLPLSNVILGVGFSLLVSVIVVTLEPPNRTSSDPGVDLGLQPSGSAIEIAGAREFALLHPAPN